MSVQLEDLKDFCRTLIAPLNDAHFSVSVDHSRQLVCLASEDRFYEEYYDGAALDALIYALQLARGFLKDESS